MELNTRPKKMKFNLKKKNIIITGGNSGIGNAIVECLAEQGATIHILDVNKKDDNHHSITNYECNIADSHSVNTIIKSISDNSKIDILINNAGIAHIGNIENTTEKDLDKLYNVNIKGLYNCTNALMPNMKLKGGLILNMASIASSVGINNRFAYSMTKGAVLSMTYSIAKDYVKYGIRCNSISPARIHTPFVDGFIKKNYPDKEKEMFKTLSETQPIGRMGKPEEVAHLALFLCSDEASFITGTDFPIDGGFIKLNGD